DAAVEQAVDLLAVGLAQIVEGDGAVTGVGYIRRDRSSTVGRADGAGNKARPAVLTAYALGGGAGELRAFEIELISKARHFVVGLGDRGRRECVGGDDVGADTQVSGVDILDRPWLSQDQQVIVAPHVAVEAGKARAPEAGFVISECLDHGAHRAIEHENSLASQAEKGSSLW